MDLNTLVENAIPIVKDVIAGMLLMSDSGTFGGLREANAIAAYLKTAQEESGGNLLIDGIVNGLLGEDGLQLPDLNHLDATRLLENVANLAAVFSGIEGGEQVKVFIYGLAEHVAGASGGGLFGRGQKVSAGEQQLLDALRGQLGI